MNYRHEWKHELEYGEMTALRSRLRAVFPLDSHAINGINRIRSLYFDDPYDRALREKIDGVNIREKFRIRYYNDDTSYIVLEKKSKWNGLGTKEQARLTVPEAEALAKGRWEVLAGREEPLLAELYRKMQSETLRPHTIVDYTREPYTYNPGNVRITIDYNIRTGLLCTDFLNPNAVTIPAANAPILLEVKWDAFLPSLVRDIVQIPSSHTASYSKYEACRIYG